MFSHHCPLTQPVVLKLLFRFQNAILYISGLRRNKLSWLANPAQRYECAGSVDACAFYFLEKKDRGGGSRTYGCRCACPAYGAHFDFEKELDGEQITDKLNRLLPPDIAVYGVKRVRDDAHARFDATYRTYKYYVTTRKEPFNRQYAWRLFSEPDFGKMNEAAHTLFDYTDFTSFSKLHTDVKTNNCKIMHAEWTQVSETEWVFTIQADRFLRNMVQGLW